MEPPTNLTPAPSSAGADELTKLPPDSPLGSEKDDGHERGSESNEGIYTENGSRSGDKNQSSDTEDIQVRAKDSETEPDSLKEDVKIVLKNQHKYYLYCPCCGEDITKTVKLVKKSDLQPTKNSDTENEAINTENGSRSKDKKTKVPSWFPVRLQQLFLSVYRHNEDKGKKGVDSKDSKDLGINGEEPMIDVRIKKDRPGFPNWFFDVFAWLFLFIIIVLSILSTSPPPLIQPHLQLPSMSSWRLPSASLLLLVPTLAALLLVIMAMMFRYRQRYHEEKGIESKPSIDTNSQKTQYHDEQAADPDQDSEMKKDNQKVHPMPLDPSLREQPSEQIVNKENAEIGTPAKTQPEISISLEPRKGSGNIVEILKCIVYGGLTESITSLCTVTSAAASGASTLNVLALGVANLSSGLLLIVHSLQELIKEKPRGLTNTEDQKNSEAEEKEEDDRYVEVLGRRERLRLHSVVAISSFVVFGLIPPLVYGFSYRRRIEKRQEYKVLAVSAVSLVCVALLSIAKAYVSKKRQYLKTLFRYTTMATTASGFSQFVGYMVSQWLEKSGFYDDSPETPRV